MQSTMHIYEVRRRKDKRGVDLISDALPFGRLCYGDANAVANAVANGNRLRSILQLLTSCRDSRLR